MNVTRTDSTQLIYIHFPCLLNVYDFQVVLFYWQTINMHLFVYKRMRDINMKCFDGKRTKKKRKSGIYINQSLMSSVDCGGIALQTIFYWEKQKSNEKKGM